MYQLIDFLIHLMQLLCFIFSSFFEESAAAIYDVSKE